MTIAPVRTAPRGCALSNTWSPRGSGRAFLALALVALLGTACGCGAEEDVGAAAGLSREQLLDAQRQVKNLVRASTPLEEKYDETFTSDVADYHFEQMVKLVGRLKESGSTAVGELALRSLRDHGHPAVMVENNLLEVAAYTAPEATGPYLEKLVLEYGHPLHRRTEAVRLLAETHPERAVELFRPILLQARHFKTYPDMEFFVRAWATAHDELGTDPTDVLVDVATNLFMQDAARHFAVKELGKRPSRLGRQALEAVMIESTGNGVLRRYAAQALRKSVPAEEACEVFRRVASREAELGMLQFLANMIDNACGGIPLPPELERELEGLPPLETPPEELRSVREE